MSVSDSPPDTLRPAAMKAAQRERPRPSSPPAALRVRALECRLERGSIAIPVEAVGQIVEYEVAPLPLTRGAVRGLGIVNGKLVVSLGVGACDEGRRRTKGILLRTAEPYGHWAFEVSEVISFIEVEPPRAGRVRTVDAREIAWLDVEDVVARADAAFADGATR